MRAGRCILLSAVAAAAFGPLPAAHAAGPPLPSWVSGKAGAVAPGGTERLLTRRAGDDTDVIAVRRGDRTVLRSRRIGGRWHVPAATIQGATTGLSADGDVLVLARPARRIPPSTTDLAVLDARTLQVRRHISLPGFFTVDAISPDGRWLYLIQYAAGGDPRDYRVRALDTRTGLLAARDVVDPREPDEQMGGFPITRTMSRDGRWAYTLYAGGSENFVHALDTVGRTAACIDLEMLTTDDLAGARLVLSRDGRRLRVRAGGSVMAIVDTRTFAVREPGEAPERAKAPRRGAASPQSAGFPWPALLGAAVLSAVAVAVVRRRALR